MEQAIWKHVTGFIEFIGIPMHYQSLAEDTFLPGLLIENGCIYIDMDKLKYPGDILHEAGHIAVICKSDRETFSAATIGQRKEHAAEEMMAIAWSFAACKYLKIDPYYVFHEAGYKGGGKEIADHFEQGHYFGVSMLQYAGMSAEPRMAERLDMPAFPTMTKWLRD